MENDSHHIAVLQGKESGRTINRQENNFQKSDEGPIKQNGRVREKILKKGEICQYNFAQSLEYGASDFPLTES
jgi:hypothetical protein